jgi:hypothetical protein
MSRSRTYIFTIENFTETDWEYVCNLEKDGNCEYISACKYKGKINGFIRFINPKYLNSVQKIFDNATLEIVKNNDLYYKEKFSKNEFFFESGKNAKQNKKTNKKTNKKQLIQLIEEKDKIIIKMVEKQNTLIEEKDKIITKMVEKQETLIEEKDKIITLMSESQETLITLMSENQDKTLMLCKDQIIKLIETFNHSKDNDSEQIKQISNICMTIAKNTPTTITNANNNNTTNNTKFNLNFFLNEQCKDAMNLVDFAKSIKIKLEDIMLYKKIGHAEAVSQIFDNAYKNMDLKMRPMHCTDVKRETLYVRNEDKWVNDESKEFAEKAIDIISNNSFRQFKQWKEANPDYMTNEEKKQEYTILMKQLVGGSSDREMDENVKKILKNISKNTQLSK